MLENLKKIVICSIFLVAFVLLTGCRLSIGNANPASETTSQAGWQTYTSSKYNFSIQYPPGWEYLEVPTLDYPTVTDQVWFASESFPPPQTGARADITLILIGEDPSPNWQAEFFEDYKAETIQLGNLAGTRISGINKESQLEEIVVIVWLEDGFLQALPSNSPTSIEYFDRVIISLTDSDLTPALNAINPP